MILREIPIRALRDIPGQLRTRRPWTTALAFAPQRAVTPCDRKQHTDPITSNSPLYHQWGASELSTSFQGSCSAVSMPISATKSALLSVFKKYVYCLLSCNSRGLPLFFQSSCTMFAWQSASLYISRMNTDFAEVHQFVITSLNFAEFQGRW